MYMFYGPPGTGKTSLIKSIATHFKKNIAYLFNEPKFLKEIELKKLEIDLAKFIDYYDTSAAVSFTKIYPAEFITWVNSIPRQ